MRVYNQCKLTLDKTPAVVRLGLKQSNLFDAELCSGMGGNLLNAMLYYWIENVTRKNFPVQHTLFLFGSSSVWPSNIAFYAQP